MEMVQEWGAEECATRASVMAREELTWAFHGWEHTSGSARFTDPATKSIRESTIESEKCLGVLVRHVLQRGLSVSFLVV